MVVQLSTLSLPSNNLQAAFMNVESDEVQESNSVECVVTCAEVVGAERKHLKNSIRGTDTVSSCVGLVG